MKMCALPIECKAKASHALPQSLPDDVPACANHSCPCTLQCEVFWAVSVSTTVQKKKIKCLGQQKVKSFFLKKDHLPLFGNTFNI